MTPEGKPFYSAGVNSVRWSGDWSPKTSSAPYSDSVKAKYTDEAAWANATAKRLQEWGWNTIGSWSSVDALAPLMPYTEMLSLAQSDWQRGNVPDYFSEEWAAGVEARAEERVPRRAADAKLVGWFIDKELRWGPDWRGTRTLFDEYLALDAAAAGKRALVATLRERHATIASLNEAWGSAFTSFDALLQATSLPDPLSEEAFLDRTAFHRALARRFFEITTGAIRRRDPNHLVLGVRFVASLTPREIAQEAGRFLDVVSVNANEFALDLASAFDPDRNNFVRAEGGFLQGFNEASGRPVLVTEFGFRAADSGVPNTWPPFYPTLATQAERADRFEAYARRCFAAPWVIGHHWFEFADQPAGGRFDGEDNNRGLVNVKDEAYDLVTARSKQVHAER